MRGAWLWLGMSGCLWGWAVDLPSDGSGLDDGTVDTDDSLSETDTVTPDTDDGVVDTDDTDDSSPDTDELHDATDIELVPAGTFTMGSPETDPDRTVDEVEVEVTLTRDLWVMRREVTQGLYEAVTGSNPSTDATCGSDCPVTDVSWFDALTFANALSARDGLTAVYTIDGQTVTADWDAEGWRLPTEAEWEHAARGGEAFFYAGSSDRDAVGWYAENSDGRPHRTCAKQVNGYGLCDMSGNAFEWTWNWYASPAVGGTDPTGPATGDAGGRVRVYRGGSWKITGSFTRVAARTAGPADSSRDDVGLRLVRLAE